MYITIHIFLVYSKENHFPIESIHYIDKKYTSYRQEVPNRYITSRKQVHWRSKANINHIQAHRKHHTRTHHCQPPHHRRQQHRPLRQPPYRPLARHHLLLPRLRRQCHQIQTTNNCDLVHFFNLIFCIWCKFCIFAKLNLVQRTYEKSATLRKEHAPEAMPMRSFG